MIYMRQKGTKNKIKQENSNEISKNTVMNMLKNKINKAKHTKVNIENIAKEDNGSKNQQGQIHNANNINKNAKKFYIISKNKGADYSDSQSKISQSIIVHDVQKYKIDPHFHHRHQYFAVEKCFDFKINNEIRNHHTIDTYISMLQKQKDMLKQQLIKLKQLKNCYNQHMATCTKTDDYSKGIETQINQLKTQFKQLSKQFEDKQLKLNLFYNIFIKSREVMLSTVMQLIDIKNQINIVVTPDKIQERRHSINLCMQKIEKVMTIFNDTLKDNIWNEQQQTLSQLKSTIKYQQKIINLIKQNDNTNKLKQFCHENALLRYEINRLTQHNENLLHLISIQQKTIEQNLQTSLNKDNNSKNQINTPMSIVNQQSISKVTMLITQRQEFQTTRYRLEEELKKNKKDYELQKQFLIFQCQSKSKEIDNLLKEVDSLNKEVDNLKKEMQSLEISKECYKALQDNNELLKHKIQYMTKDNETQSVTIQKLLNFLNKSELKRYHKALMELISTYQFKISQLTQSYLQQKQQKDHLNTYHKGLNNILKSKIHDEDEDEDLIDYCNRFDKLVSSYRENRIDTYLRQIKGYTIGIDSQAKQNIQSQLIDYIDQLKSRMPALTQEYLDEDGSSVANSSIDHFD